MFLKLLDILLVSALSFCTLLYNRQHHCERKHVYPVQQNPWKGNKCRPSKKLGATQCLWQESTVLHKNISYNNTSGTASHRCTGKAPLSDTSAELKVFWIKELQRVFWECIIKENLLLKCQFNEIGPLLFKQEYYVIVMYKSNCNWSGSHVFCGCLCFSCIRRGQKQLRRNISSNWLRTEPAWSLRYYTLSFF